MGGGYGTPNVLREGGTLIRGNRFDNDRRTRRSWRRPWGSTQVEDPPTQRGVRRDWVGGWEGVPLRYPLTPAVKGSIEVHPRSPPRGPPPLVGGKGVPGRRHVGVRSRRGATGDGGRGALESTSSCLPLVVIVEEGKTGEKTRCGGLKLGKTKSHGVKGIHIPPRKVLETGIRRLGVLASARPPPRLSRAPALAAPSPRSGAPPPGE